MIDLRTVSAGYNGREILTNISLSVLPGECVGLIGPSGSGKTTLLRCLTGEIRPTSGEIA
ncbi:MAG: ABC transporter ATP-binding protein [Paracoccaceae bacterium]